MTTNNDDEPSSGGVDIAVTMAAILGTMVAMVAGLIAIQTPAAEENDESSHREEQTTKNETRANGRGDKDDNGDGRGNATTVNRPPPSLWKAIRNSSSNFLPSAETQPSKRAYELFVATYTPVWIGCFAVIVAGQLYERFDAFLYLLVCGGLALPFLLQPAVLPSAGFGSPDSGRTILQRYATKANVWLAMYSFIGNYWYTHYFYSVLDAAYTMPAHRLNNVPVAMFCATHFYFSTYHWFSNALLRWVVTTFAAGPRRACLFAATVLVFSYFTAFMETLTISSYPYYTFRDRNVAYTAGSAFYGIYFLVSFPAFFYFDDDIDAHADGKRKRPPLTIWDAFVSSCGHGMMILILLDFVRLYLNIPLVVGATAGTGAGAGGVI